MAFCKNCGSELEDGAKFCPKCGAPTDGNQPSGQPANQSAYTGQTGQTGQTSPADESHGLAIGSLVCGVTGIILWFFGYYSVISIAAGIVGLVLANNAKKNGNTEGICTAGFVLSLLSLIVGIIIFIYLMVVLALVGSAVGGVLHWLW
jgi:hypothetical protein